MENKTGFEFIQGARNPLKAHWNLFITDKLTLLQLESVCFVWVVQHESLFIEKPLPTEPLQHYGTSKEAFARVMKAWHLGYSDREMENKSNTRCLNRAKKFFLTNDYDEGKKLFDKYAEPEIVPF